MYPMDFMEPITRESVSTLRPGEWIWDDKPVVRREHRRSLGHETITEPIGFRQIDILDTELFPRWSSTPFMLSDCDHGGSKWEYFEEGRYYRIKNKEE